MCEILHSLLFRTISSSTSCTCDFTGGVLPARLYNALFSTYPSPPHGRPDIRQPTHLRESALSTMADPDSPPETAHHLQQSSLNTSVASIRVNGSEGYKGVTEPSSEEAVQSSHAHQEENLDVTEINRRWEAIRQRRVARRAARAAAQPKNIRSTPQNILEDEVDRYDHKIWGFKIYRLTYDDDWKWQAFMEELVRQTRTNLERELKGSDLERLTSMLDWAAENDKTKWDGATLSQVRKYVHAYYWYCCFHSRGFWN